MGTRPQPEMKRRLLDACTDHALAHGLPDRIEPLASTWRRSFSPSFAVC